jgi:hypothetical protein
VLRWNGATWSVVKTFAAQVRSASVAAGNDVWVFGYPPDRLTTQLGAWHYDGHAWTRTAKNVSGGSALSARDVWGFSGTAVEHWNGRTWTGTSVRRLLPPNNGRNDPSVTGILAQSEHSVYAVGNSSSVRDPNGTLVVLHYDGSAWTKVASGVFGSGPFPEFSSDGSGGLWLPMAGSLGGTQYLVHYAGGKLVTAVLPVAAAKITIESVARIPGSTGQLAAGFTHNPGSYLTNVTAVILRLGAATAGTSGTATASSNPAPGWHIVKSVKTGITGGFTAVVATGKATGWGFDGRSGTPPTAWRQAGKTWQKVAFPGTASERVIAAGASSPSDVWAFTVGFHGGSRVLRWNGVRWSVVKTFAAPIAGASVAARGDVWVFGYPQLPFTPMLGAWHYDGRTWTRTAKDIEGGSALSATDVWGFSGTAVDHWNGHKWTSTSVKSLLPARLSSGLNDPGVTGILALSPASVYAIGNGNRQDEGGPTVVLHYNGHTWAKVASGNFGFGTTFDGTSQQVSPDGSGGCWLPMPGVLGAPSYLVHYADGKLIPAVLPVAARKIKVESVARIPGTTSQLAGGFTFVNGPTFTNVVAVLLQLGG